METTILAFLLTPLASTALDACNGLAPLPDGAALCPAVKCDLNSSNGFKAIRRNGVRIDWILTRGDFAVDSAEIVTFSRDGQFPSDHFPVVTRLRMGAAK